MKLKKKSKKNRTNLPPNPKKQLEQWLKLQTRMDSYNKRGVVVKFTDGASEMFDTLPAAVARIGCSVYSIISAAGLYPKEIKTGILAGCRVQWILPSTEKNYRPGLFLGGST